MEQEGRGSFFHFVVKAWTSSVFCLLRVKDLVRGNPVENHFS